MPGYTQLELEAGYGILPDWYDTLVDVLEEVTEKGAVTYGGYVRSALIPDLDLLLNLGEAGRRFLYAYIGYGYFTYAVIVGDVIFEHGWKLTEDPVHGIVLKSPSGKKYRIVLEEVE